MILYVYIYFIDCLLILCCLNFALNLRRLKFDNTGKQKITNSTFC
ncbi:hypothetical protein CPL00160_CDS0025 [Escherchia phage Tuinin]|nr:hypothetical protein G3B1_050 [Escherichia phage vB_EcoS-G3B1]UGO56959.1 hypothetical protein JLBYU19_80 [Escherichia phage JLBYU19]